MAELERADEILSHHMGPKTIVRLELAAIIERLKRVKC